MIPEFGVWREKHNELFFAQYKNPHGSLHFHSPLELYIVDEGAIEVWINDRRTVLYEGEISVALSYDSHCYHSVGDSKASLLIIPTYMCKEFLSVIKDRRATNYFIKDTKSMALIRSCYDEIVNNSENTIKTLGYINVILGTVMESLSFEPISTSIEQQLSSRILFYVNENYKNDISLGSIAAYFGYNPSYISRYFRSCFNVGLNQYITLVRLKYAIILMTESQNSVTYCAFESGFNSMRTFYRAFYNEFKCTPKEYLENIERK